MTRTRESMTAAAVTTPPEVPTLHEVFRGHYRFVWNTLRRLGVPEARVDDAVQDTFLVVHRRLAEFRGDASMRTWVFRIAARVAANYRRSAVRHSGRNEPLHVADLQPASSWDNAAEAPDALLVRARAHKLLLELLEALDDDQRSVWVLSELEQLTAPEISRMLDVKLNTVYSRLRLARARLEKALAARRPKGECL